MEIVHNNRPLNGRCTATVEDFDRLMAVNARSTFVCYKHVARQMIAQGRGGRIIGANIFLSFSLAFVDVKMFRGMFCSRQTR
jgi:NAD(P)-dependent dehydrogenase (short-subunit alcohol dehydrogenase family)